MRCLKRQLGAQLLFGFVAQSAYEDFHAPHIVACWLMTERERNEYREKMRNAKSLKEQEEIRSQHHDQMKERAKARGVMLPDEPPPRGVENAPGSLSPGRSGAGGGGPGGGGPGGPGPGR